MNISDNTTSRANARLNRSLVFCLFGLTGTPLKPLDKFVVQLLRSAALFYAAGFAIAKILNSFS